MADERDDTGRAGALGAALKGRARAVLGAMRDNPWWFLVAAVVTVALVVVINAVARPGGVVGVAADARNEVELSAEELIDHPSPETRDAVLGSALTAMWTNAGLDATSLYDNLCDLVKYDVKSVEATASTARVVMDVTHLDLDTAQTLWLNKVEAYPTSDVERAFIRDATYEERMAVVLGFFEDVVTSPAPPTRTEEISFTLNRGSQGWNIENGGWERSVVLGGADLADFIQRTVVVEQPYDDE